MGWAGNGESRGSDDDIASGGLAALVEVLRAVAWQGIKKAGAHLAHGSWFVRWAVLPPVRYLESGADLPRSAALMGAVVCRV